LPNSVCHSFYIIGNAHPAQVAMPLAVAVSTQTYGMSGEAVLSEVIEKMNIPTPGRMPGSVYKKEWC